MEIWDIYNKNRQLTGRTVKRGDVLGENEYHLVVSVWIRNSEGKWLITKRSKGKSYPLKWEATGGSVLSGETSKEGALREVKEEIGIELSDGFLFASFRREKTSWKNPGFLDVWVFRHDFQIRDTVLQEDEVCDICWATSDDIVTMIAKDEFVPIEAFPYYKDLFERFAQK